MNAAEAPLVIVKLLMATDVPVIAPPVPAFKPKSNAPVMPAPKVMAAPAGSKPVGVATLELSVNVTPPVPKFITSPLLVMVAATLDAALPLKVKPPSNANVLAVALPKVTRPVLRKSTFNTKVFVPPVMLIVVAVAAVVIKLFT